MLPSVGVNLKTDLLPIDQLLLVAQQIAPTPLELGHYNPVELVTKVLPTSKSGVKTLSGPKSTSTTPSTQASRKSIKPLLEKQRRARMNNSLNELKQLLQISSDYKHKIGEKTEKADILEMAVNYMRQLSSTPESIPINDVKEEHSTPSCIRCQENSAKHVPSDEFVSGYAACSDKIATLIATLDFVEPPTKIAILQQIREHLQARLGHLEHAEFPHSPSGLQLSPHGIVPAASPVSISSGYSSAKSRSSSPGLSCPATPPVSATTKFGDGAAAPQFFPSLGSFHSLPLSVSTDPCLWRPW